MFRIAITPCGRDSWFLIIHYEVIAIIPFGHDRWFTSDVREALCIEWRYPVGRESGTAASIYGGILDGFVKGASDYPNSEPYIVNDPRFQLWSDITNGSISIFNHFREDKKKKWKNDI